MITPEDIENIALLSKLYITEEDIPELQKDLQQMVSFAAAVHSTAECDVYYDNTHVPACILRDDVMAQSLPQSDILKNSPETAEGHFLIRKKA